MPLFLYQGSCGVLNCETTEKTYQWPNCDDIRIVLEVTFTNLHAAEIPGAKRFASNSLDEIMNQADVLNLVQEESSTPMLDHLIEDRRAWTSDQVEPKDWTVTLSSAALQEIETALEQIRSDPLPTYVLSADQFEMPECAAAMAEVKKILNGGVGVAILDRLPLDEMSMEEANSIYWVIGQFLGTEVAQKWDGTMQYDVTNTGLEFGYGVRGSWTDVELFFHTDNAFGIAPPEIVSLLCINPAQKGGISRFCSLYSAHNEMLAHHPELLRRLYEPSYFDRQAEHAPGDPRVTRSPTFRFDGKRLKTRLAPGLIHKAHKLLDEEIDKESEQALTKIDEVMNDPNLWIELTIQRGQMQYINNSEFAHFRSKFEDADDPALKRHLIRMWYREEGRRSYNG